MVSGRSLQELDEHVVTLDPLAVLGDVPEQVLRLRILDLMIEQDPLHLALHVGLAGEDEDLDGLPAEGRGAEGDCGNGVRAKCGGRALEPGVGG